MALIITEDWIRERVNLKHDNLEDVRSLSLCGNYVDKIDSLGSALRKFSRLKSLDLSRNAITSLEGLEHLKMLEKLNLYYNNVPTLSELYRLRGCESLQELDLRLNPVARNEPDYRLFLIHMLPSLRKLDDRGVRDSERKAAVTHFGTDQASQFKDKTSQRSASVPESKPNPRAEYVKNLAKKSSALDDDDVELLDLIARTKGDLSQPRHITGSSATQPEAVDYSPERIKRMESAAVEASAPPPVPTYPPGSPINKAMKGQTISGTAPQITPDSYHNRYPHLFGSIGEHADPLHRNAGTGKQDFRVHFQDFSHKPADTNLKYQDEIDAYTSYKVQGHFTPHPGTASSQPNKFTSGQVTAEPLTQEQNYAQPPVQAQSNIPYSSISPSRSVQHQLGHTPPEKLQPQPDQRQTTLSQIPSILEPPSSIRPPPDVSSESVGLGREELLSHLCDLADKYWNGAKSLHRNSRFQKMAHSYLNEHLQGQDAGPGMAQVQEQIDRLKQENSQLRERLESLANQRAEEEDPRLKNTLHQAQKDVEILRERLQQSIEENKVLQQRLSASEGGQQTAKNTSFTGLGSSAVDSGHLEELHAENQRLQHETDTLKIRLKQYAQMQELASMLQESHKSLVQTNEHLIRELDESRERHKAEVQQLHWSYEQMKKTASFLPSMGDSTHTNGYQ